MARLLCDSLLENYRAALGLVAEAVGHFEGEVDWLEGVDEFQVPAKIAYHIADTLDYYFREAPEGAYRWGHRFGGGWWALDDEQLPSPAQVLDYLAEVQARIEGHLAALEDGDLASPFDAERQHGQTRLSHYVYALRHTMHHHGALSLLSLSCGHEPGHWA
jgi:hypothetical protein